ncbi:MAG: dihydroneopterin aldolase [Rhodoferax sp.]
MKPHSGHQHLEITGLRFNANLGILDHERENSQPISVDVELNQGKQPLQPDDDHITNVLDYRKVHSVIVNTCTERHVNLLESLTGKLCNRLLDLPSVVGVKVKIIKLEIFDDCEVSISMQAGEW